MSMTKRNGTPSLCCHYGRYGHHLSKPSPWSQPVFIFRNCSGLGFPLRRRYSLLCYYYKWSFMLSLQLPIVIWGLDASHPPPPPGGISCIDDSSNVDAAITTGSGYRVLKNSEF